MEVVIKDGTRIVNWECPRGEKLGRVLSAYEKGYRTVRRDLVRLNGRRLLEAHLDCPIWMFAEKFGKLVFQVVTVKPEKVKKEAVQNG